MYLYVVRKNIKLTPRTGYTLVLEGETLTFVLAFLICFSFLFSCSRAHLWCFWLPRCLLLILYFCCRWCFSFLFSVLFSAGLMPRNLENTACRHSFSLHRRWRSAFARPWILHLYVFACHIESPRQLFFFYPLSTWTRAPLLYLALWTFAVHFCLYAVARLNVHSAPR